MLAITLSKSSPFAITAAKVVTEIVISFAGEAPPKRVPAIVKVSDTSYAEPGLSRVTV